MIRNNPQPRPTGRLQGHNVLGDANNLSDQLARQTQSHAVTVMVDVAALSVSDRCWLLWRHDGATVEDLNAPGKHGLAQNVRSRRFPRRGLQRQERIYL